MKIKSNHTEYIDHALLPESFYNKKAAENLTDLLPGNIPKKKYF